MPGWQSRPSIISCAYALTAYQGCRRYLLRAISALASLSSFETIVTSHSTGVQVSCEGVPECIKAAVFHARSFAGFFHGRQQMPEANMEAKVWLKSER